MNQSLFEELFNKKVGHIKPGLERMHKALNIVRDPDFDAEAQTILVGGTNGKGGTSGFLWTLLGQALKGRKKVGLFTSPHLVSYRERFSIFGQTIGDQDIIEIWKNLKNQLGALYEDLSFFELSTLIAYKLFAANNVYISIYEVGLGGRLDSTNALEPDITILTSISKDHELYLGSQLLGILKEKLGICRRGVPLYWGAGGEIMEDSSALAYIEQYCSDKSVPLISWGEDFFLQEDQLQMKDKVSHPLPKLLHKAPDYILKNFALAYQVALDLKKSHKEMSDLHGLLEPMGSMGVSAPLVGRFQRLLLDDTKVIIDVCHNPDGLSKLISNLRALNIRPVALVSILKDKDHETMLDQMIHFFEDIIFFGMDEERSLKQENLHRRHRNIKYAKSFMAALALARTIWHDAPQPWVICGSILAVGKVFESIEKDPLQFTYNDVLCGSWSEGDR